MNKEDLRIGDIYLFRNQGVGDLIGGKLVEVFDELNSAGSCAVLEVRYFAKLEYMERLLCSKEDEELVAGRRREK